ncbi:MAG: tripartite tricarboxylate transporter permease [Hyphomicrobiaceae bacterium]
MDLLGNLALGFEVALSLQNLLFCFLGALVGTLIGVLPGLGPLATLAMLLPVTFYLPPIAALIMLAGIYYGAQYGGSTTAILVNLPGESSSVVTCLDGYQMARNGRAGAALAVAALGSLFAGTFATFVIALASPILGEFALNFLAAEYFSLMVLGLVGTIVLARGSMLKATAMALLGLVIGIVGTDVNSGNQRYTFNITELSDGIGFIPVAMGLFAITEILVNLEQKARRSVSSVVGTLMPTRQEAKAAIPAILRGTAIGSMLGVLPGGGAMLSSFAAYALEKKVSRDPSRFGKGAIEGVAAPESANNAGAQTSFIPLLTLGIPSNPVMAIMVGAMMIQGIQPGPQVMTEQPKLFWGIIASMWIGNLMLVIINLPMVGLWVKLLTVPYRWMFPTILLLCSMGVYGVNNSWVEVGFMAVFGVLGYSFYKLGCEPAPLVLAMILGPLMEENLRRALLISRGDPMIFVERPISLTLLLAALVLVLAFILPAMKSTREEAFKES